MAKVARYAGNIIVERERRIAELEIGIKAAIDKLQDEDDREGLTPNQDEVVAVLQALLIMQVETITSGEWQPMSSAPRDGTRIELLRKPHPLLKHPIAVGRWQEFAYLKRKFWQSKAGVSTFAAGDRDFIGWRPIKEVT